MQQLKRRHCEKFSFPQDSNTLAINDLDAPAEIASLRLLENPKPHPYRKIVHCRAQFCEDEGH